MKKQSKQLTAAHVREMYDRPLDFYTLVDTVRAELAEDLFKGGLTSCPVILQYAEIKYAACLKAELCRLGYTCGPSHSETPAELIFEVSRPSTLLGECAFWYTNDGGLQ